MKWIIRRQVTTAHSEDINCSIKLPPLQIPAKKSKKFNSGKLKHQNCIKSNKTDILGQGEWPKRLFKEHFEKTISCLDDPL